MWSPGPHNAIIVELTATRSCIGTTSLDASNVVTIFTPKIVQRTVMVLQNVLSALRIKFLTLRDVLPSSLFSSRSSEGSTIISIITIIVQNRSAGHGNTCQLYPKLGPNHFIPPLLQYVTVRVIFINLLKVTFNIFYGTTL